MSSNSLLTDSSRLRTEVSLSLIHIFEVYGFLGPQISVAKSQNVDVTISADGTSQSLTPAGEAEMRARIGASARCV